MSWTPLTQDTRRRSQRRRDSDKPNTPVRRIKIKNLIKKIKNIINLTERIKMMLQRIRRVPQLRGVEEEVIEEEEVKKTESVMAKMSRKISVRARKITRQSTTINKVIEGVEERDKTITIIIIRTRRELTQKTDQISEMLLIKSTRREEEEEVVDKIIIKVRGTNSPRDTIIWTKCQEIIEAQVQIIIMTTTTTTTQETIGTLGDIISMTTHQTEGTIWDMITTLQ